IICQKKAEEQLHQLGIKPERTGHFNALRGLNRLKEENVLIVAGRTLLPVSAAEEQARALWSDPELTWSYQLQEHELKAKDGSTKKVRIESHKDPRISALIAMKRDD